ncbi:hypothetical protein GCM10027290_25430 [Micromonospora sonneratiae]
MAEASAVMPIRMVMENPALGRRVVATGSLRHWWGGRLAAALAFFPAALGPVPAPRTAATLGTVQPLPGASGHHFLLVVLPTSNQR